MIFRILFFALLATSMGQSVVITTLPSLGREAGLSEFQVATLMSTSAFIFALGSTLWSRVAKGYGYRKTLMLGLTGYTIGTLVFATVWFEGFSGALSGALLFGALLVSRSMQSSIMSASPPAAVGYAIAISPLSERVKAISKVTSANNLGQVLGPSFAGALVVFGLLTPLYCIVILTLVALFLVWKKLPLTEPSHPSYEQTPQKSASTPVHLNDEAENQSEPVSRYIITCVSLFTAMAMMQQSLAFFLIDNYHYSPVNAAQGVGVAMMISAICALLIQLLVIQRRAVAPQILMSVGLVLLTAAYATMYLHTQEHYLYAAMLLLGCGMGTTYPALAAQATSKCLPQRQATVTGMITAAPAMGYVTGPPLAAWVYQFQLTLPFALACVLMAVMTLWHGVASRKG